MESTITENIVLRDWLSFTSKKHTPEELIEALGMSHCPWTETNGAKGYRDRLFFGSISVFYNGREDMGVWVEMSGQGCRNFEDLTKLPHKWDDLFKFISDNNLHISRFDVAYDDHTGILKIDDVYEDVVNVHFVSPFRFWQAIKSSVGTSVILGSPRSRTLVRIYDKAAERGFTDGRHWVRVELQMRDSRACEFIKLPLPLGEAFAGVLLNYVRFVKPDDSDSNKSRWAMTEYWANLIGDVGRISIYTAPGGEYNLEKCKHYVTNMAGNAIAALLDCYSTDDFLTMIRLRSCAENPKYNLIVKEYHAKQEAYAKRAERFMKLLKEKEDEEYES